MECDALDNWKGVLARGVAHNHDLGHAFTNDYDLACAIHAFAGVLHVNERDALVLADEPLPFFLWQPPGQHPHLVGVYYTEDINATPSLLARSHSLERVAPEESHSLVIRSSRLCVFDSAWPGSDLATEAQPFVFELPVGSYLVETRRIAPDAETSLLVHSFVPLASASEASAQPSR